MNATEPQLSIIIITYNEAQNIERCLESLPSQAEVIVVDSNSEDETVGIAKKFGAIVHSRPFKNYSDQKNYALSLASREWVLSVDADEILSDELAEAVKLLVEKNPDDVAFTLDRRLIFMGQKMRFGRTADAPLRLFKKQQAQFEGSIHEVIQLAAGVKTIKITEHPLWHYSYDSLSDYFNKFNDYTSKIAEKKSSEVARGVPTIYIVIRPWVDFFYRYILRLGFLDGYPGYCWAMISCLYSFVKYAKYKELADQRK